MHIFNNIKTYNRPASKQPVLDSKSISEKDKWWKAPLGCLFAIVLFVGMAFMFYAIGSAIVSFDGLKDILLTVGGIWLVIIVLHLVSLPFILLWNVTAKIHKSKTKQIVTFIIVSALILLLICGLVYICGSLSFYEPTIKMRPDGF